jgi:SAM-dependent methyltransferase
MGPVAASSALRGRRCPRCVGELESDSDGLRCGACGSEYAAGPYPGTLTFSAVGANFAQALDAEIVPRLIPALDALDPPACSERLIECTARELGIVVGNPVWEGRADLARLLLRGEGTVALDVGCGFGTFATALARSADHVFATDRSPVRVALTAARARAEGLDNLTAFETNSVQLPLGDALCDLVTIVGVLEWAGVGSGDAPAAQRALLAEVRRVLKPGGVLLLGIENRYAAHYFAGVREDHTLLRFSSLLPRRLADVQSRRARGVPFETPTHSRAALKRLLRDAGLQPRVAAVLPSYQQPRFAFDEADARDGLSFYVRHAFHASSTARRLAGRALLRAPAGWSVSLAPSYWAVAAKAEAPPAPIPGVITGSPHCDGAIKAINWRGERLTATSRLSGDAHAVQLVDGWNARRWVSWPLRAAARAARRRRLAALLAVQLQGAAVDAVLERADALDAAQAGLDRLSDAVAPETLARCRALLDALPEQLPACREHGDLILNNAVVRDGAIELVDRPREESIAPVGRDAATVVLDLCAVEAGAKQLDLAAGVTGLERLRGAEATAVGALLRDALADAPPEQAEALLLAGVLRHLAAHGAVTGAEGFLAAVADGRLTRALAALPA